MTTNIFGKRVEVSTEYDNLPEKDDSIVGIDISKPVCLAITDKSGSVRLLHGAYHKFSDGNWYHRGYVVNPSLILYW